MEPIAWWRTAFGPEEANKLCQAITKEHISQGVITEAFETAVAMALNVPYAIATTSGSMALLLGLIGVGIKQGDEVIVPNRTFIATAHAALFFGAKVVLADTRADIPVIDIHDVREKITSKTRAIMPVHLNGRAAEIAELRNIAEEYGLRLIEDAAQAIFSRNELGYLGTQGDVGCFSLGMTKLISTGQGGIVVTPHKAVYEQMKLIRNHGVVDTLDAEYNTLGFNFKYTDLQAAIGLVQLDRVHEKIAHVKKVYSVYAEMLGALSFLELLPVKIDRGEVPLWVEVLCHERAKLMKFLDAHGIQTRKFLPDLHISPHLGNTDLCFPRSKRFAEEGMILPCGPAQPLENIERVIDVLYYYNDSKQPNMN